MNSIYRLIVTLIFTGLFINLSYANQNPQRLATDKRLQVVVYNPNDIVTLVGHHLISTGIKFNEDERIITAFIGDTVAWDKEKNDAIPYMMFIKPNLPESDTDMTVLTDKRIYRFRLVTHVNDSPKSKNVTYGVTFKYPETDNVLSQSNLASLQSIMRGNATCDATNCNDNYWFTGSKAIAPIKAIDNGTFTILKFAKNTPIPAIFAVDNHRNESLVNFRTEGDYIIIQGVRHQYTLRQGEEVTTIYNDSFKTN